MTATPEQLKKMGAAILNFEARRDRYGHLAVYELPEGDGGGRYEVAGINERYHPEELDQLIRLIRIGRHDQAEEYASQFFLSFTGVVNAWGDIDPGVEFYLRDSAFNRGPTGAARILQRALGVRVDGKVGAITKAALAAAEPKDLLKRLRAAREWYEREYAHRGPRNKFWRGLVNRWDKALVIAESFST